MAKARRTLTDAEILGLALNTSAARRLQGRWPGATDRRRDSIAGTAVFLWLVAGLTVVALVGTFVWEARQGAEEDCDRRPGAGALVECAERTEGKRGRKGQDVGHGAQSGGKAGADA